MINNKLRDRLRSGPTIDDAIWIMLIFIIILMFLPLCAKAAVVGETLPENYQWSVLEPGLVPLVDREYTIPEVPSILQGLPFLRTANDDKTRSDLVLVRFTLDAPATVLVFHDLRAGPRDWLADWRVTGETLMVQEPSRQTVYTAYAKDFAAGEVALPGPGYPEGSPISTNYFVALKLAGPCEDCVPTGAAKLVLTWDANPVDEQVIDYSVYRGGDADASELLAVTVEPGFERDAGVLGLRYGETVCFRVQAHSRCTDGGGEPHDCYSGYSDAACTALKVPPDEVEAPVTPSVLRLEVILSVGN